MPTAMGRGRLPFLGDWTHWGTGPSKASWVSLRDGKHIMIDPLNVTDFGRSDAALEEFLLFCIFVAGKSADQQAAKLERFLEGTEKPFDYLRRLCAHGGLEARLRALRIGRYRDLGRSLNELARGRLPLRTVPWETLAGLPGIGFKTAKFFCLHSRPRQTLAVLDTHLLKWIAAETQRIPFRGLPAVPTASPQAPGAYAFWETLFFGLWKRHEAREGVWSDVQPDDYWARVDLDLWKMTRSKATGG